MFTASQKFLKKYYVPVVALVVVIGMGVVAVIVRAAPTVVVFEAETGQLSQNIQQINDTQASGGSALEFKDLQNPPVVTCNLNATTANFAAQVSAAQPGQTICLATGNYGQWGGTNKAITIRPAVDAMPSMSFEFRQDDGNFTIDSIDIAGGAFLNYSDGNGPKNITIRNSAFKSSIMFDGPLDSNILLDNNTHININFAGPNNAVTCGATPAAIHFPYNSGTKVSGVTIQNSLFKGGNKDGIQTGIGVNVINNEFDDIGEHGARCGDYNDTPHTDSIQLLGANRSVIRGNYFHNVVTGIVAYDGISNATIENNVVETISRPDGIELLSDTNSIVRNNVVVYKTGCGNGSNVCGGIFIGRKSADPPGVGTVVENNIASYISINSGSTTASNRNNMLRSDTTGSNFIGVPSYVGGSNPTIFDQFELSPASPGIGRATDGGNVGIR